MRDPRVSLTQSTPLLTDDVMLTSASTILDNVELKYLINPKNDSKTLKINIK